MSLSNLVSGFVTNHVTRRSAASTGYLLRLAVGEQDVRAAQALRFAVFNMELSEGLSSSYDSGLDVDAFDPYCEHLIVEHATTGQIIGTYRMQLGRDASHHLGYYSAQEFDLSSLDPFREQVLELGRACIDARHRNFTVLSLLWKGIMGFARENGARYLVGCSSLTSQDSREAWGAYHQMSSQLCAEPFRVNPLPGFACPQLEDGGMAVTIKLPKLLSAYLALGAEICGPPAIDREFKTIDFLTLMDLDSQRMATRRRRFGMG